MAEGAPSIWSLFTAVEPEPRKQTGSSILSLLTEGEASGAPPPVELNSALSFDERKMFWAMRDLPVTEALKHLAILGVTGSGKSTLIQLFLQSIAPRFKRGATDPQQLIIFDGKCEAVTQLASLEIYPEDENVYILNPYDERCAVWDIGAETNTPLMARNLASLLVPEEKNSNAPYFSESACDLIYSVMLGLNRSQIPWTLRDLIIALDSKNSMQAIAGRDPRGKTIFERIFADEKHSPGVHSSLATKIVKFEQVAALWHSAKPTAKKFTIDKFLSKPGVLILGDDPKLHASVWPLNALLLKALTEEILRNPKNSWLPKHWFVLDEFPAMEKVPCVRDLLRRGRSKGVSVTLGTQGVESLYENYKEDGTEDILSQCANKIFLRAGGPKTAEWAARYFGQVRSTETSFTESWGKGGGSYSKQHSTQDRPLFLSSTFKNLPLPSPGGLFSCISDVPIFDSAFVTHRWFDDMLSWLKPASTIPAVLPRLNVEEQTLQPWSAQERKLFTGKTNPKPAKENKSKLKKSSTPKKTKHHAHLPGAERRRRKLPPDF